MFCGPGSGWGGWHMSGWHMPGFIILILIVIVLWLVFRRQSKPAILTLSCPKCSGSVLASYFRCPHCGENLKHNCPNCSRIIDQDWSYCPYCNENQSVNINREEKGA